MFGALKIKLKTESGGGGWGLGAVNVMNPFSLETACQPIDERGRGEAGSDPLFSRPILSTSTGCTSHWIIVEGATNPPVL